MKLKVLAQSKEYVVVHKPSGFVTYADSDSQKKISAQFFLEAQLKRKLFPVHRIDKDTCGALAYAFSHEMARALTELFRSRVVRKQYLCVVHGLAPERGTIDEPLEKNKEKVKEPALTDFVRLAKIETELEGEKRAYSLVRCEPKTGRYHQIRRHMKFIGHPIVGDPEYGNAWDNRAFEKNFGVTRTLLCASYLAFPDRKQEKMVRVQTLPDADFLAVAKKFSWKV